MTTRRPPPPVSKFNRRLVIGVGACLALLALGGYALPGLWSEPPAREVPAPVAQPLILPEVITREVVASAAPVQPIQAVEPASQAMRPPDPPPLPASQAIRPPVPVAHEQPAPASQAIRPPVPKKRWASLAVPVAAPAPRTVETKPTPVVEGSSGLIQPARWAIPADPTRTLYMSQTMAGVLTQPLQSDLPGRVIIVLTVPVFDKFGQGVTLVPKGTLLIAQQVGTPQYGQTRLQVRLLQMELPGGEVVGLKAMVGDEQGTNGLQGTVNNHYGKLLLATGISAVLAIGSQAITGTPGPQQFFRNPAQEAAQDIAQDVQQTAQGVVDRELRVPPTITRKAGTFCTITLEENLTFTQPPVVVR